MDGQKCFQLFFFQVNTPCLNNFDSTAILPATIQSKVIFHRHNFPLLLPQTLLIHNPSVYPIQHHRLSTEIDDLFTNPAYLSTYPACGTTPPAYLFTYPACGTTQQAYLSTYPACGRLPQVDLAQKSCCRMNLRFIRQQLLNKLSPQLFQTAALPRVGSLLMNRARNPCFQSQLFPLPLDMIDINLHGLISAGLNRQLAQSQGFGGFR